MQELTVLSASEISHFEEHGFVCLREAFLHSDAIAMQDFMWLQLQTLKGIDRHDRSTWTIGYAGSGLNKSGEHTIYKPIASPRLCGAIDDLLGNGNWSIPKSWGGFLLSFPQGPLAEWNLPTQHWHWDSGLNHFEKCLKGLFIFTLFSEIKPHGGGTLFVSGSQRMLANFWHRLSPSEQKGKIASVRKAFYVSNSWLSSLTSEQYSPSDRIQHFMETAATIDDVYVRVHEMTGEPGDAYLCHPSIFHSGSPNHREVPRFMRAKQLSKQQISKGG
ncbi:phytanoyl-CoA dioxygenase family protein [Candidatus Poribacteria bacterium]|nr:phytanoyl-CoA dioxygenase family protein [Candidatus Poribacteria bacterium]